MIDRRKRLFPARLLQGVLCAAILGLAGCGGGGSDGPTEWPIVVSPGEPDADGVVTIVVSGLPAGLELPQSAVTVIEAGQPREVTSVDKVGPHAEPAPTDVAFVVDTTSSMRTGLDSVKDSVLAFVDQLAAQGLDMRLGAVTFGDAFDTRAAAASGAGVSLSGREPPAFDPDERPSFALSDDFTAFRTFVGQQQARGGGKDAENVLGALAFAYDTLDWRAGAQRVLIVVTDTCSYNDATYSLDGITAPWIPATAADVVARLRGRAITHVISPERALVNCVAKEPATYTDMNVFTGADGTGGLHVDWAGATSFDLSALPITQAVAGSYRIKYVSGVTGKRTVEVIVDDGRVHAQTTVTVGDDA